MHIGIVVNVFFLLLFVLFILFSFIEEWHCWVRAGHDRNLPSLVCVLIPNRLFTRAMPAIGLHVTFSGRQMWTNVLREVTVKMKRALKDRWSSISNDVIDWPLYPATYCCARVRNLLLFFLFFFTTLQAAAVTPEPEMVRGSLSVKRLAQVSGFTSNGHQ